MVVNHQHMRLLLLFLEEKAALLSALNAHIIIIIVYSIFILSYLVFRFAFVDINSPPFHTLFTLRSNDVA